MKFKYWCIATITFFKSYYSDYENAYGQGVIDGYDEGYSDGWNSSKTAGQVLWSDMYFFLKERKMIDNHEEVTSLDIIERLLEYERGLKSAKNPVDV